MNAFRYVARLRNEEDFSCMIGKFDDNAGNSIKIFMNENGTGLKYVIFDDIFCAKQEITFNADLLSSVDFENPDDKDIEELLRKLGE